MYSACPAHHSLKRSYKHSELWNNQELQLCATVREQKVIKGRSSCPGSARSSWWKQSLLLPKLLSAAFWRQEVPARAGAAARAIKHHLLAYFIFWPRELNVAIAKKPQPATKPKRRLQWWLVCVPAFVPVFIVLFPLPHFLHVNGPWYSRRVHLVLEQETNSFLEVMEGYWKTQGAGSCWWEQALTNWKLFELLNVLEVFDLIWNGCF